MIAQQGRAVDLIVCGKASDDLPDAWSDFAETALMRSGRPVLIVPPGATAEAHIRTGRVSLWMFLLELF